MDSRKNVVGRLLRSVTFRLILLTLASGLGLWLGAGSRSTLPGKPQRTVIILGSG